MRVTNTLARVNPEETRERILNTATKLFYTRGILAVGVNTIAAEAGVTKRTLYKHFASKDKLIAAYLEARNQPILTALIQSIIDVKGNVSKQVEGLFVALGKRSESDHWQGCPFARAVSELRDAKNYQIIEIADNHKTTFEEWLQNYLHEHGVKQSSKIAKQIIILMDGAIVHLLIHRDPEYAIVAGKAAVALVNAALAQEK